MPVFQRSGYREDNIAGLILDFKVAGIIHRQIERHLRATVVDGEGIACHSTDFRLGRLQFQQRASCHSDSSGGRSIRHKGYAIVAQRSNAVRLMINFFHSCDVV